LIKRPFVEIELQPIHRVQDRLNRLRRRSFAVRVLDAKYELAAVVPGKKKIEKRRARAADVQVSGRARSEACSNLGHSLR